MNERVVNVLVVDENQVEFSLLSHHLEKRGGRCRFASSNAEAARLFSEQPFDLVLCSDRMAGIHILISSLIGSPASLFCSDTGEASCWWLPAVLRGKRCLGAPALRSSEFVKVLDQLMDEFAASERAQAIANRGGYDLERLDAPNPKENQATWLDRERKSQ